VSRSHYPLPKRPVLPQDSPITCSIWDLFFYPWHSPPPNHVTSSSQMGPLLTLPVGALGETSESSLGWPNIACHGGVTLSLEGQSNGVCSATVYKSRTLPSLVQCGTFSFFAWHKVSKSLSWFFCGTRSSFGTSFYETSMHFIGLAFSVCEALGSWSVTLWVQLCDSVWRRSIYIFCTLNQYFCREQRALRLKDDKIRELEEQVCKPAKVHASQFTMLMHACSYLSSH